MSKIEKKQSAYEVIYNYRYMLETGYTFDEYAKTVAHEIERPKDHKTDKDKDE